MQIAMDLLLRRGYGAVRCWRPGQGYGLTLIPGISEDASNHSAEILTRRLWGPPVRQQCHDHRAVSAEYPQLKHDASCSHLSSAGEAHRFQYARRLFHSAPALHSLHGEESLSVLTSGVDTTSEQFSANTSAMKALVSSLEEEVRKVQLGGGVKAVERHRKKGKFLARERIDKLLDPESPFLELSQVSPTLNS